MAAPSNGTSLETKEPMVQQNGLNTNKAVNFSGFLVDTSGNVTVPGTQLVTGVATFTAPPVFNGGRTPVTVTNSATVGATVVLTAANSGSVLINVSTSGSPSWTLPAKQTGLEFTFICGNTTAGFTVTAADAVIHFKTSASGTVLTSTTTLTNTQGTAIVGDFISIVCDGTAWWMKAISGIFAAS
jgi:hypothetical protein